jgi:hypothetical protein
MRSDSALRRPQMMSFSLSIGGEACSIVEMATRYIVNLSKEERLGMEDLLGRKHLSQLTGHVSKKRRLTRSHLTACPGGVRRRVQDYVKPALATTSWQSITFIAPPPALGCRLCLVLAHRKIASDLPMRQNAHDPSSTAFSSR